MQQTAKAPASMALVFIGGWVGVQQAHGRAAALASRHVRAWGGDEWGGQADGCKAF